MVRISVIVVCILSYACMFASGWTGGKNLANPYDYSITAAAIDTIPLIDRQGDFITDPSTNPFDITPSVITQEVEYDPDSDRYIILEKIGEEYYRNPSYLTFEEYIEWRAEQQQKEHFQLMSGVTSARKSATGKLDPFSKVDIKNDLIDRLFGGNAITIRPQGNIDLTFGLDYQRIENPTIAPQLQRQGPFLDFDMDIQMNVEGKIGEKMDLNFNYNTQATFDFDNKIKINYDTEQFSEDDIIKKIEAGDVSLPLRSQLIPGAQNLFGLKTELQFGRLRWTGIASQQRSESKDITLQNGVLEQEFELRPDDYDENRHFFVSHYNRKKYEHALSNLPQIKSIQRITNIEVWVTNDQNSDLSNSTKVACISYLGETDITKFSNPNPRPSSLPLGIKIVEDLEKDTLPSNEVSRLFDEIVRDGGVRNSVSTSSTLRSTYGLTQGRDFEVQNMRRLNPSEFTFHPQLGYISLNVRLRPNQVLGVAYEYTYACYPNTVYKVGEISNEASAGGLDEFGDPEPEDVIIVKMLKSSNQRVDLPSWDLMMKNVYSLNTNSLNDEDFQFDIFYENNNDNGSFVKYLPVSNDTVRNSPLLNVFQLDQLNSSGDAQPDGIFDFVPGVTVNPNTGSIFYPVLEPFGSSLKDLLKDNALFEIYNYQALYDSTLTAARELLDKNRFAMKGRYKSSSSSEISLGAFNIPQGSVTVRAGSQELIEGVDYDIDYGIGRIKIVNEAYLQAGVPIRVSFEDRNLFSLQQKTMFGMRFDFAATKKLNLGATYMRLFERPFTEKVNLGDDPISNRVFGLDLNYSSESDFITRMVDRIPFYNTKEKSFINFDAEFAALKPGHSKAINVGQEKGGVVSIDDFEGSAGFIPLGSRFNEWKLASTPRNFKEFEMENDLAYGYNRALTNWYVIDDRTIRSNEDSRDPYTRRVDQNELFVRNIPPNQIPDLLTFDVAYYPEERGPYNFDPPLGKPGYSAGLDISRNGGIKLKDPESRWGGIMRYLPNNDFEASNFQYIEFWMLDPFINEVENGEETGSRLNHDMGEEGSIFFNLGNVSEDILKDNAQFFENAIPTPNDRIPIEETSWGEVPNTVPQVQGFDREYISVQDLGLDGVGADRDEEKRFFSDYVKLIEDEVLLSDDIKDMVAFDPSADDYLSYRDPSLDAETNLLNRYKKYNNPEGNVPDGRDNNTRIGVGNPVPDAEDLNGNRSLEVNESYYEYEVKLKRDEINGGIERVTNDFITDTKVIRGNNWYRFRIPIETGTPINDIQGFRSIQFIRMFMTGFTKPKVFRLAEFELVRNQWRTLPPDCGVSSFEFIVDEVGIEENSEKTPFRYVSPAGIKQERLFNTFANILQDEKSIKLNVDKMSNECDAKIYKLTELDLRFYESLQMFVHAENPLDTLLTESDMSAFIRLGKDFDNNYYEYEIPLQFSDVENRDASIDIYRDEVWKNMIDFKLEELTELKKARNSSATAKSDTFSISTYVGEDLHHKVTIKGNPSLGYIKGITLGIRTGIQNVTANNDATAEVWFNELRMAGLKQEGGVAGLARMEVQLADLGDVTASGLYTSTGYGEIDQQVVERNLNRQLEFDIATNLNLGNFFKRDWNLRIPFYAQYAKNITYHKFDQIELDLTPDEVLQTMNAREQEADNIDLTAEKEDVQDRSTDETTIKTFTFTNVRKDRGAGSKGQSKPWSPENFSASYAYTQTKYKDVFIKEDVVDDYRGSIEYNYSRKANFIKPFKNAKLKMLKEFNFSLFPNSFSFSNEIRRFKSVKKYRLPLRKTDPVTPDFVFNDQRFDWDRRYSLRWDFTKGLKLTFNANNYSVVDELKQVGIKDYIDDNTDNRDWVDVRGNFKRDTLAETLPYANSDVRDYIRENIRKGGRNKNYDHNIRLSYTVPIHYLPGMDWVTMKAQYDGNYTWSAGSLIAENLGNVIQNSQNRSLNGTFNFKKLYDKFDYFKNLDKSKRSSGRSSRRGETKDVKDDLAADKDKKSKRSAGSASFVEKLFIRPLLSLRNVKFTYREDLSTVVPGFTHVPQILGLSSGFGAPGAAFVLGLQPNVSVDTTGTNWLYQNVSNNKDETWIVQEKLQNQQVLQNNTQNYEIRAEIEPWKDVKIDLNMKKTYTKNNAQDFYWNSDLETGIGDDPAYTQAGIIDMGMVDVTYFNLNTLFNKDLDRLFSDFKTNREILSARYDADLDTDVPNRGEEHEEDSGYKYGYGQLQNDVVIHSFLATYTGKDINTYTTDFLGDIESRSYIPKPNWSLRYNGLSKLDAFKNIFSSFTLNHAYKSNMRVGQYKTDLQYAVADDKFFIPVNSSQRNYYARFEIPTVTISEQFVPILGFEAKTTNNLLLNFQYAKTRTLNLTTGIISQLQESRSTEYTFGLGWTIDGVNIGFLTGDKGSKRRTRNTETDENRPDQQGGGISNDRGRQLTVTLDVSFRGDITWIHNLNIDTSKDPTRGLKSYIINPAVEYDVNENLTLRAFVDYSKTRPLLSNSFPITNIQSGITARFNLN